MRIEFTKMQGLGNDFAVFDAPGAAALDGEVIRRLADRHTGIGFDQALVLEPPRNTDAAVFYRIFNADGLEVEQCGNGARCIAALLAARGLARSGAVTMDSPAGLIRARILQGGRISVDMGPVRFEPRSLPFDARAQARRYSLELAGESVEIGAVSIGNPHAVLAVESVEAAAVERLGPAIEGHPRFPKRVNAGFMQIVDRTHIRLRVYERGAGETLACGTGACAAVAVGRYWGQLDCDVHVSVRGGELRVNWNGPEENIWLTGAAEVSFAGHVEV
ncbi:MAG TPA: diaminopimelate epimerase [Steroidobacteraceae bacterium]|jgi:diaminopimelate epimerase|nr:diaminopimelate epimerase [Steroidobacteraceae bacterium]